MQFFHGHTETLVYFLDEGWAGWGLVTKRGYISFTPSQAFHWLKEHYDYATKEAV